LNDAAVSSHSVTCNGFDIETPIVVAVDDQATDGTLIDPHRQRDRLAMTTTRAGLTRVGRVHPHDLPVLAVETERNEQRRGITWQFTSREARVKLERLYPVKEPSAVGQQQNE
jgi:hypothetical protein